MKLFFSKGYLFLNPDVKKAKVNPLWHYLRYGIRERRTNGYPVGYGKHSCKIRNTSFFFNEVDYLEQNPDVKQKGMDAWEHYVCHGYNEKRNLSKFEAAVHFFSDLSSGKVTKLFLYSAMKEKCSSVCGGV